MAPSYRNFPTDLDVIVYSRKSREDLEAEERARRAGDLNFDVLARHRKRLLEAARAHRWNIIAFFEEVVSGELLDERPEIQKVLDWVENKGIDGVLTIDIDRFGRGDSADQGIIQRAFKDTDTLILTPDEVYDLNNDSDEERVEFKSFFARRELKSITKRMQNGRRDSVKEGWYIGTYEPYGYYRDRNKGLTLIPSERAEVVRTIFEWYVYEQVGAPTIAERLNSMSLPCPTIDYELRMGRQPKYPDRKWTASTVNTILKNEVYIGRLQWQKTRTVRRRLENGRYKKFKSIDRPKEQWLDQKGKHEPLVSVELFEAAQKITSSRSNRTGSKEKKTKNPLRGLIECKICGSKMQLRPYQRQAPHLLCPTKGCNRSSQFVFVEEKLLEALKMWYQDYKVRYDMLERELNQKREKSKLPATIIEEADRELAVLQEQKNRLHDLVERGVYDTDTFIERNAVLTQEIKKVQERRANLMAELQKQEQTEEAKANVIPLLRHILDSYHVTNDPNEKNNLLRQVIHKVEYFKADDWVADQFELTLHPLL